MEAGNCSLNEQAGSKAANVLGFPIVLQVMLELLMQSTVEFIKGGEAAIQ